MARFRNPFSGQFTKGPGLVGENPFRGTGWVPNPAFTAEMRRDPAFQSELRTAAAALARVAEENIRQITREGFMPRPGPLVVVEEAADGGVIVLNTDHGGHLYEFGSVKTPPYAPMRRAVRAVGLEFAEGAALERQL